MLISDYLNKKASKNKIPLNGAFELSPICNFSCHMCYVRRTQEQIRAEGKKVRDWKEWLKLAEECKNAGMLYVLLTGGEPFLYPHFRELYEKMHDMGLQISINSNGSMITPETIEWLKHKAPNRINITLYGASAETYGRVCGNPSGYQRTIDAILALKAIGIPVVVNASMIPENVEDMEKILDFGKNNGINVRMATYMFPPVRRDCETSDSRFNAEEAAEYYLRKTRYIYGREGYRDYITKQLEEIDQAASQMSPDDTENEQTQWGTNSDYMTCRAGRCSFWVSWDGKMVACGLMSFPFEKDPFRDGFLSCWSELTDAVRSIPVMEDCRHCHRKQICRPCAAMLYAETGDVNRKPEYLCTMAENMIKIMREDQKAYETNEE